MKCAACGTLNDADALYCKRCGVKLGGANHCPGCDAEVDADALFCSKCGTEIASSKTDKGKTCQSCGFINPPGTSYCKRCNQKIM